MCERKLTQDEIKDILSFIQPSKTLPPKSAKSISKNIIKQLVGTQGFFQVDFTHAVQAAGFVQWLGGNVDAKNMVVGLDIGDSHASAVDGDAVAQADIGQIACGHGQAQALAVL